MMCSILYSGEKETVVEVWCLHYNQVRRLGDVRCLSILISLVSSKVMNITYMIIPIPITGPVLISQQRNRSVRGVSRILVRGVLVSRSHAVPYLACADCV